MCAQRTDDEDLPPTFSPISPFNYSLGGPPAAIEATNLARRFAARAYADSTDTGPTRDLWRAIEHIARALDIQAEGIIVLDRRLGFPCCRRCNSRLDE